jgi:peptide/nickel transport system permease protein
LVTANTKQVITFEYVSAARTLGASDRRIIVKHILPNVLAPIIVIATFGVALGILSEAGLTFLGLGSPVNNISYGTMIATGVTYVYLHPQLSLVPGFAIFFLVFAINLFGDSIRDALDPRLKD